MGCDGDPLHSGASLASPAGHLRPFHLLQCPMQNNLNFEA